MNDRSRKPTHAGDALLPALRARRQGNRPSRPVSIQVHLNRRRIKHLCRALYRDFKHIEYPPFGYLALRGNLTSTQHTVRAEPASGHSLYPDGKFVSRSLLLTLLVARPPTKRG